MPKPEEEGRPYQNGYGPSDVGRIARGRTTPLLREEDDGDGGNVEPGYPVEGGYFRDKAVALLRHFYVQENGRGKLRSLVYSLLILQKPMFFYTHTHTHTQAR